MTGITGAAKALLRVMHLRTKHAHARNDEQYRQRCHDLTTELHARQIPLSVLTPLGDLRPAAALARLDEIDALMVRWDDARLTSLDAHVPEIDEELRKLEFRATKRWGVAEVEAMEALASRAKVHPRHVGPPQRSMVKPKATARTARTGRMAQAAQAPPTTTTTRPTSPTSLKGKEKEEQEEEHD